MSRPFDRLTATVPAKPGIQRELLIANYITCKIVNMVPIIANMSDQFAAQAKYISEQVDKRLGASTKD